MFLEENFIVFKEDFSFVQIRKFLVFVEDFLTGSTNAHTFVDVLIDDDVKKICGGGFNFC